jgi:teichoic acid transport system ATP-binding protein
MTSSVQFIETRASRSLVAVRFRHVTKTYRLYKSERQRLMAAFWPGVKHQAVTANNDLTFTILRGESVAFLGNNGAGKSTAMKIISGVTTPTAGTVEVHGRVSALLDLSAGFDSQLTGRQNLRLRARLWGLSEPEIQDLMPEIAAFAEVGKFLDQPMRTYSSGMKARLGFAFASFLKPDILILDEVLSVGDRVFREKSLARMQQIMGREGVTLLFVTHSLSSASKFCQRALVLDHGKLAFDGAIGKAISYYKRSTR